MKSLIVGCGGIAQVHAKAISRMDHAQLVGCADIRKERAEKMAEEYQAAPYNSLEEMLNGEQADVLHICTPHYLHVPMALEALKRGIHVFMEKPPAISQQQLEQLIQTAQQSNAKLCVCFQNRYNASVQKVKELLSSGEAGKVLGARAFVTWCRGEKYYTESGWRGTWDTEGGGVLINQSIHTLDLLRYFLGEPDSVDGTVKNHHLNDVIEVEDTAEAYIRFGDVSALFYATTAFCTDSPVIIELICEKMTIRMEERDLRISYAGGKVEQLHLENGHVDGKGYWGSGHQACISDFYRKIEQGENTPISIEDAGKTLKLMLGIYQSSETGKPVSLK